MGVAAAINWGFDKFKGTDPPKERWNEQAVLTLQTVKGKPICRCASLNLAALVARQVEKAEFRRLPVSQKFN